MVEPTGAGVEAEVAGTAAAVVIAGVGTSSPRANPTSQNAQKRIDLVIFLRKNVPLNYFKKVHLKIIFT